jgi:hypothetical protein
MVAAQVMPANTANSRIIAVMAMPGPVGASNREPSRSVYVPE